MNNNLDLKTICEQIEQEIWDTYIDDNGKADPIIDGNVDIEKYQKTEPKILWILKEPYDDEEDGLATGWKIMLIGRWAASGTGVLRCRSGNAINATDNTALDQWRN